MLSKCCVVQMSQSIPEALPGMAHWRRRRQVVREAHVCMLDTCGLFQQHSTYGGHRPPWVLVLLTLDGV